MKHTFYFLALVGLFVVGCTKDKALNTIDTPTIASPEYVDKLLFVNKNNYQLQTSIPATFSSIDPNINISSSGLIAVITSGEVVPIVIKWNDGKTSSTTIYALGATDTNQPEPAAYFHGETATDPYD